MTVSKELLRARIEKRFDKRMELGMLDEVKVLVQKNPPETDLKRYGIEYVELAKHLRGESTLIEARKKVIEKSWQYAKRQMTWNKKYFKNTHKVDQGEK
jgi:tRNA dimethylallyltransferase